MVGTFYYDFLRLHPRATLWCTMTSHHSDAVLPEELCDVIVHHMEPSTLLAALHLNKTYLRLCTSQELWRAHAERRWGQGVPPTTDYRRHYVQRSTMGRSLTQGTAQTGA